MVILLNYLPWVILFGSLAIAVFMRQKRSTSFPKSALIVFGGIVAFVLLQAATPSYMPKAEVKRIPNPSFQAPEAEIQDRLRAPELSTEERQQRFDDKFNAVEEAKEKLPK